MIAKKIAYCCCKNEEEQEIVQYGLELILENIGKAVGIIGVALFTGYVYQVIIAAIVFMSLRSMAGGIHCKTSLGCFLAMLLVIGISVGCCHLIVPIWIYIKVARNSVGRSIPLCMYEPRVPKSLKQKNVKVIK